MKSGRTIHFRSVNVSVPFHDVMRKLAAHEGKRLYEVLDTVALPAMQKRLLKLQTGGGSSRK